MPTKSFLLLNTAASGSTYGSLQDGGITTTATTATGWTVGTTAGTVYANQNFGSKVTAATFGATPQPAAAPANAGECWRSTNPLTGHFEAGTWTIALSVIAVTSAATGTGRLRVRIWKSANANGSAGVELTTSTISTTQWNNLTTATAQNLTGSQAIAAFTFANEYLFIEVACEIDTASGNAGSDVLIRIDQTNSKLTTAIFDQSVDGDDVEPPGVPIYADGTPNTALAVSVLRDGDAIGITTGISNIIYYKMQGWYATGSVYESWVAVGVPNSSPPSGHVLTDIKVIGSFTR